jgi:hypothetical protein
MEPSKIRIYAEYIQLEISGLHSFQSKSESSVLNFLTTALTSMAVVAENSGL